MPTKRMYDINTRMGRSRILDAVVGITANIFLVRYFVQQGTWDCYLIAVAIVLGFGGLLYWRWRYVKRNGLE